MARHRGERRYWMWFVSVAFLGCTLDLCSKSLVFAQFRDTAAVHWLWPGYVGIQLAVNTGALFGLGQDRVTWLAMISAVAIGVILYWYFTSGATRDWMMSVALGAVAGGILGNLYDRLGVWGGYGVRDWILLAYGRFTWPNFNLADTLLIVGAGLLICRTTHMCDSTSPSKQK